MISSPIHDRSRDLILARHPWLSVTTTVEDYVDPAYYDRILKDYVFDGRTDLALFREDAGAVRALEMSLELGCGTGRATDVFLSARGVDSGKLTLVDLSPRMIAWARQKYAGTGDRLELAQSDSLEFLRNSDETFDYIYSLWSFSHATHQLLTRSGLEEGSSDIRALIRRMVEKNMRPGSRFFLIHFDSRSDEQRVLIELWKRVFPIFADSAQQSPSKLIIDDVLEELDAEGAIALTKRHLIGEPITYSSLEEALEVFLNFHAESYFNERPDIGEIIDHLTAYFARYRAADGTIAIRPGCFIYSFRKLAPAPC